MKHPYFASGYVRPYKKRYPYYPTGRDYEPYTPSPWRVPVNRTEIIERDRTLTEKVIDAVRRMGYTGRILAFVRDDFRKTVTVQVESVDIITLRVSYTSTGEIESIRVVDNGE